MLPTHGWGPVRRFLLGSVTAKVLHDVSTAVWTLRAATALAQCYRAQLSLVHVAETPRGALDIDFEPYKKDLMDAADHWLWQMKRTLAVDAPHRVVDAAPSAGIRETAIQRKADLIVVGRGRAQDTFGRMWSQLCPIIRESPCPVLSI